MKAHVGLSEVTFKKESTAADARNKVAKEGRALRDKASKTGGGGQARARASGVCPHAMAAPSHSLGELRDATTTCDEMINDPGLADKVPGDGTLGNIKAIISTATGAAAFVNSLCGK